MLSFFIILLLQSGLSDNRSYPDSNVSAQVSTHLSAVKSGDETPYHLWHLLHMATAHEGLADHIRDVIKQPGVQGSALLECVFDYETESGISQNLAPLLYRAYTCTSAISLLVAALYEADEQLRNTIYADEISRIDQLPGSDASTFALIQKAMGLPYDEDDLFMNRSFRLQDYYLLARFTPSSPGVHRQLMGRWEQEILQSRTVTKPSEAMKLMSVVTAYHTLDGAYNRVYQLTPFIAGNAFLSDIIPKQVMLKRVAFAATVQGYFHTALLLYRNDLLPLSESMMSNEEFLRVSVDYANILFRLGNVNAALTTYEQVLNHPVPLQDVRYRAALLNNLAVSYLNAGFFDEYVSLQLASFDQASASGNVQAQIRALTNLYIYHWRNQDWNNAVRYLNESLALAKLHNLDREMAEIYILFGTYSSNHLRDYEQALSYIEMALDVIDPELGFFILINAYTEKVNILSRLNRNEDAIQTNNTILELVKDRGDIQAEIELTTQRVMLLLQNDRINDASGYVDRLMTFTPEALNLRLQSLLANALTKYSFLSGNNVFAIDNLRQTVSEIIRAVRLSGDLQSGFIRLESGYEESFTLLIDHLISTGSTREAIAWLDEIKNLNKAAFVNSTLLKSSVLTEEEFLYDVQLTNRIDRLRSEMIGASEEKLIELNTQLLGLLNEKNQFNNRVLSEFSAEPLDVRRLQRDLGKHDQILSYQAIDSVMYIISINRNDVSIHRQIITKDRELNAFDIIEGLRNTKTNLHQLYAVYEDFVGSYLADNTRRLFVIPDAFLYQIPLEILPRNKTPEPYQFGLAQYLIEDMAISYQNSLNDLYRVRQRVRGSGFDQDYVGIAISQFDFIRENRGVAGSRFSLANLPFAKAEIEKSYSLLSALPNKSIYVDEQGTPGTLMRTAGNSRILHIASHSLVYHTDPLFSIIQLYPDQSDSERNGQVYAYELFAKNMTSELIVLSSCDSGSGAYIQGSGIIGLGRALTYAGAQSLVLNLWSIRDQAAAELMANFYSHLGKYNDKDKSLREAKLRFINESNSDPAVWGSLIIFGDPGPLYNPIPWLRISLLLMLIVVAGLLFRYYRK